MQDSDNHLLFGPFNFFMPNKDFVQKTIAPLYDTVDTLEAKDITGKNPFSFLHVSKAEVDLEGVDYNDSKVYEQANMNLNRLIADKIFIKHPHLSYIVYKISKDNYVQHGLVALCSVEAIANNVIKQHELTRPDKEQDRVKNIKAVKGSLSPVMLTHSKNDLITTTLHSLTIDAPNYYAFDNEGILHEIYIIDKERDIDLINASYKVLDSLYIADGHHRTQAALKAAADLADNKSAQHFMVGIFPEEELNIMGYHRIIKDLNGRKPEVFLQSLEKYFDITGNSSRVLPDKKHTFGMYLAGEWYYLALKNDYYKHDSVLDGLDCKIINDLVITPLLGIKDITTDKRIDFFGGSKNISELEQQVNNSQGVAFTLAPTTINELIEVSNNEMLMPPKSTWFYPKLCDGLFFYLFDE